MGNPNATLGQQYAGGRLPGQDAFGINTVSMFGNYPAYYDQYARDFEAGKYSPTSKFAQNKYQHALNVNKANLARIQKDFGSTNQTFNWQDHEQDKGGDVPNITPTPKHHGDVAHDQGGRFDTSNKSSSSPQGYSARSHSGGDYGGKHHWADGGRVGLRYGGLLSIL